MANGQENAGQSDMGDAVRNTGEQAAEQTRRIGQAVAGAGNEMIGIGARMIEQQADLVRTTWRVGYEVMSNVVNRSTEHLNRTMGLAGEGSKDAAERSARNAETILHSTTVIARGMGGISRECVELARHQMEQSLDLVDRLWGCRTAQDLAAVQSDSVRQALDQAVQTGRKVADLSLRIADETAYDIKQGADEMGKAA